MQIRNQQVELDIEQWIGSKLGKEYKAIYCHPVDLIYMQSTSCEMPSWMNYKLESRLPGEISKNSDMQMTPPSLMAESEEELESILMKVKEESEKAGLQLNIQKTKIMAFSPITFWLIEGEKVEAVTDFLFLGSKIAVDGDCSHAIRSYLLLGRKAVTNLDSVLKSRITLPTKFHIVKALGFPVVMYGCESWTIKKAER